MKARGTLVQPIRIYAGAGVASLLRASLWHRQTPIFLSYNKKREQWISFVSTGPCKIWWRIAPLRGTSDSSYHDHSQDVAAPSPGWAPCRRLPYSRCRGSVKLGKPLTVKGVPRCKDNSEVLPIGFTTFYYRQRRNKLQPWWSAGRESLLQRPCMVFQFFQGCIVCLQAALPAALTNFVTTKIWSRLVQTDRWHLVYAGGAIQNGSGFTVSNHLRQESVLSPRLCRGDLGRGGAVPMLPRR